MRDEQMYDLKVNAEKMKLSMLSPVELVDMSLYEKKSLYKQFLEMIQLGEESYSDVDIENILSNYVYVSECVRTDLREIDDRLTELKTLDSMTPAEDDYAHKKYRYFAELNRKAKAEIIDFYSNKLVSFVVENKTFKYLERKDDSLTMLFLDGRYEYAHFKRYFKHDYDYSTEAKIRFIPGVELTKRDETITQYINLKNTSKEQYQAEIIRMVIENNCIEYVRDKVSANHFLSRRSEIFDVLVKLFNEKEYQAFIALAVLQLEGLFYDCCSIMAKKELGNKAGTLVEKAEKIYSENRVLQLSVYPYFAFEVPHLRNEVAHNGIILGRELQAIANEIVLDLYSVTYWACHLTNDKYIPLLMTMDKISEKPNASENEVIEMLFYELFSDFQISDREYLDVLAKPDLYKAEIDFYEVTVEGETKNRLSEAVIFLSKRVNSKLFWEFIHELVRKHGLQHAKGKPYDVVDFVIKLKNTFLPKLENGSMEKIACINVAKLLKPFEDADKETAGE